MRQNDIHIRHAGNLDDIGACMTLQKEVWGFTEPQDMAPPPLLVLGNRYGGSVLIAESFDGMPLGFSYAFLARESDGELFWWSHMTAVAPGYQNQQVGFELKLAQRNAAIDAGIGRICWTFDPLQTLNAHFNIHKLGTICRTYEDNIYGRSSSPLHHGLPTDRLLAEWHVNAPSVVERLGGEAPVVLWDCDGLTHAVRIGDPDQVPAPRLGLEEAPLAVEIPCEVRGSEVHSERTGRWQRTLRETFHHYFDRGYVVTDFVRLLVPDPRAFYVLRPDSEKRI
jgi:predicted GNAT superfamily acetyltransferase